MIRPRALALASLLLASLPLSPAAAEPLLPPPGDPAFSAPLLDLANAYQRQQDVFCTRENGLSLDVYVDPAEVDTVKSFFAQGASDDFQAVTGLHPYDVVLAFGEHGDEGNFAGIASVGQAARLMELRRLQAPEAEIAKARDAVLRAVKAWTVYGTIGGPGVVARGVRRVVPRVGQLRRVTLAGVEPQRRQAGGSGQRGHGAQRRVDVGQRFDADVVQGVFHVGFSRECHSFITA